MRPQRPLWPDDKPHLAVARDLSARHWDPKGPRWVAHHMLPGNAECAGSVQKKCRLVACPAVPGEIRSASSSRRGFNLA